VLKKSLSDRSVVRNKTKTLRNQDENTTTPRFSAPELESENGTKDFFNTLLGFWYMATGARQERVPLEAGCREKQSSRQLRECCEEAAGKLTALAYALAATLTDAASTPSAIVTTAFVLVVAPTVMPVVLVLMVGVGHWLRRSWWRRTRWRRGGRGV
jgi:hypothetical protein